MFGWANYKKTEDFLRRQCSFSATIGFIFSKLEDPTSQTSWQVITFQFLEVLRLWLSLNDCVYCAESNLCVAGDK